MKSLVALLALVIVLAITVSADDYEKCKNDFKSFLGCVKSEYEKKSDKEKSDAKEARKKKANKCFEQAGCDAPDWDANPLGGGKGRPGKGSGMDIDPKVKECLKKKLMDKIGAKLNDCLSRKGIKNLNFSALADMAESSGGGLGFEGEHGDEAKAGMAGGMKAKFNAVKGVDKCAQKKGGDTNAVKPLEECLQAIKKDERQAVCSLVKPCMSKVTTGDCKKRGEDLTKALCQCKKEKEAEIAKKLKDLGLKGEKVGIPELMKTVADDGDMQDMMSQVDKCYKESGVEEPAMLKMAMQMLGGNGGGGMGAALSKAFSVNASTVVIMGDMMALDAADPTDCQDCK